MESYATALLYATPFFIGLVLIEILYGRFVKDQKHNLMDTVSSLSSGLTNVVKDSLGLVLILVSYPFLLEHLALIEIKATWLVWVVAFIALDFAGYWNHRLSHHINLFWNQHVIHHSSEEFNLACALRQPISNLLGYYALLLIPAALLGVPNQVIAILAPIHLFAQFLVPHPVYWQNGDSGICYRDPFATSGTPCHQSRVYRQKPRTDFLYLGPNVRYLSRRVG